jgi:hypothetical protein
MTTVVTSSHQSPAGGHRFRYRDSIAAWLPDCPRHADRDAAIIMSKTAAVSLCRWQSHTDQLFQRPAHHSPKSLGCEIAIDGIPHAAHRGFLP